MSDKMPEALRKHFEEKGKKNEEGDKMRKRGEALRKAKKAKSKRKAEKEAQSWFFLKNRGSNGGHTRR